MQDRFKFRSWYEERYIYKDLCDSNYYTEDGKCIGLANTLPNCLPWEQCAELRDKNGKLIYEGDIVYSPFDNGTKKVIFWDKGLASFMAYNPKDKKFTQRISDRYFIELEFEVVGNINENPELLEGE